MKVITKLEKPSKLLFYETLNARKKLSARDKNTLYNLQKGYEGELLFSTYTREMKGKGFILHDLLFEINQTTFQIDCLIINQANVFLYEVKNFEGDFYLEADKLFKRPQIEYVNPLHQLSRAESLLRQLLLTIGFKTPIDANVAFVHPTFTLYQAPLDIPALFPNQVQRHLTSVSNQSTTSTNNMNKLATKLLEVRKTDYPFEKPAFEYEELKKGIVCPVCREISVSLVKRSCMCKVCGNVESINSAVLQSVEEFRVLFPERRVTTGEIYRWCGEIIESKRAIHRILSTNYKVHGRNRWTYFE